MADEHHEWKLQNLKAAFQLGSSAIQAILIVNGGAAIALLALIGNLGSHPTIPMAIPVLRASLLCFAGGAATAPLGATLAWVAQLQTINSGSAEKDPGEGLRLVAGVVGLCGIFAFAIGAVLAACAIG